MANHRTAILAIEQETGESFTHFVIGPHDSDYWGQSDRRPSYARNNEVLEREQALCILDADYDSGYGGADCFPFYAWSESWLVTVGEYDGATVLHCWPRHPLSIEPQFD